MYQFNFDFDDFLATHWHQKPTIIKNGFNLFKDPISPDELAGLALEEEIDSRFVTNKEGTWNVAHGPFEDFKDFPETHSQLIIQAANHWHPGVASLSAPFKKLPDWLFDDLMICLSMPHGGVGPHIDQYDVFIVQGMGKRRWRVGPLGEYKDANHETGLRQIEGFEPMIDEVLEPGDILYIPPGFPHEGNTIETSLSYSIGYRSPKEQELLSGFADFAVNNDLGDTHYHNPNIKTQTQSSMISTADYQALDKMLMRLLNDENAKRHWLGEQLSQSRHELNLMEADPLWTQEELIQFIQEGMILEKVYGLKTLYHENNPLDLYIHGEHILIPQGAEKLLKILSCQETFTKKDLGPLIKNQAIKDLLLKLCNQGYWYPQA